MSPIIALFAFLFVGSTFGHSQMRCAKYDLSTGNCNAPIRDQAESFEEEANDFANGGGFCQKPMTNPISASYSNGKGCPDYDPCPAPMGTFNPGENFTVMWVARNHAEADQTPGTVYLYMSPVESETAGNDVSQAVMESNLLCKGPFISCDGQNGDLTQCYLNCKMPSDTVAGVHTLWWKWIWDNQGSIYTTCADINVVAGASSSSSSGPSPSSPSPAPSPPSTPRPSPVPSPAVTSGIAIRPSTSGRVKSPVTATTGRAMAPVIATTGHAKSPAPSPMPQPSTSGSSPAPSPVIPTSSSNCAGATTVSASVASIVSMDVWGSGGSAQYRTVVQINVIEPVLSNWLLEMIPPTSSKVPKVSSVLDSGSLLCQSSSPIEHVVIQPLTWAKTAYAGQTIQIEIVSSNPSNLSQQDLMDQTSFVVYTK